MKKLLFISLLFLIWGSCGSNNIQGGENRKASTETETNASTSAENNVDTPTDSVHKHLSPEQAKIDSIKRAKTEAKRPKN